MASMTRAEAIERAFDAYVKHDSIHDGLASAYDTALIAGLQRADAVVTRAMKAVVMLDGYDGARRSGIYEARDAIRAEITRIRKGVKAK